MIARHLSMASTVAGLLCPIWSEACSCKRRPADLATNLKEAREEAAAIYLGRVITTDGREVGGRASVEVLEVFKGLVKVGAKLSVPSGGGGDCTYSFEVGHTYLIYAHGKPSAVHLCSRTREVAKEDLELQWLRTGTLPPVPTSLQRQTVSCRPCNLNIVTASLVGAPPGGDACNLGLGDAEALSAIRNVRPFWTGGYYDSDDKGRSKAVGLSSELRAFELVQTPYHSTKETCRQRVVRRWCKALLPGFDQRRGALPLRCVEPAGEEEVCNETDNRAASWGPSEQINAASCDWSSPTYPDCELSKEIQPFAGVVGTGPLLRCIPAFDGPSIHTCHVVEKKDGRQ